VVPVGVLTSKGLLPAWAAGTTAKAAATVAPKKRRHDAEVACFQFVRGWVDGRVMVDLLAQGK